MSKCLFGNCCGNCLRSVTLLFRHTGVVQLHYKRQSLHTGWWQITFNCGFFGIETAKNSIFKELRISNFWGLEAALRRLGA